MKDEQETKLRVIINHNYFIRAVIVEACMQFILSCVAGFIIGMCIEGKSYTALTFLWITVIVYLIMTFLRIHKIVTLHGKISEYEDSVVQDTIHSALKLK